MRTSSMCWLKRAFSLAAVLSSATMSCSFLSAMTFLADSAIAGSISGTPLTMAVGLGSGASASPSLLPPQAASSTAADTVASSGAELGTWWGFIVHCLLDHGSN